MVTNATVIPIASGLDVGSTHDARSYSGRLAQVTKQVRQLDRVVIRFAGDSGDGMQLTGDRFTAETAQLGNDISTLPNFPAEIRAPAGTTVISEFFGGASSPSVQDVPSSVVQTLWPAGS